MRRADLPAGARSLLREDGSVVVPPALANVVLRVLLRDVGARVRVDGGRLAAGVHDLVWALHASSEAVGEGSEVVPTPVGSAGGTSVAGAASVEISTAEAARWMGCSESYVRRLARLGLVPARRVAGVWLIARAAGAADDEMEAA
ncbi:helix-turn-helix domain-containing protein [Streptomyces sp. G35A]